MKLLTDELDLRILSELEINARAPTSDIAKKAGISINTLKNRIDEMEQAGVIKGYSVKVDYLRLGYICNRAYLKLQHTNRKIEEGIISFLKASHQCSWASHARGKFDLAALFWSKNENQFMDFWSSFKKEFKPYIREAELTNYYGETITCFPFTKKIYKNERRDIGIDGSAEIDDTDKAILRLLATNGQASFSTIAQAVNLTASSAKYRIDKLIEKKVIVSTRLHINNELLGYTFFKVDFGLEDFKDKEKIEQWVLDTPYAPHIIRTSAWADVEVQLCVKSAKELDSILHEARDQFSPNIRNYEIHEFTDEVKRAYVPEF